MSTDLNFKKIILSGTIAIIATSAVAPLERIKLLLQNQREIIKQGKLTETYKNSIDCLVKTYKQEGISTFWRGNTTNCVSTIATLAIRSSLQGRLLYIFKFKTEDSYLMCLSKNITTYVAAGAISLFLIYSLDFAYKRLATDLEINFQRQYVNTIDVYKKTLATDGLFGIYRGFGISVVGITLNRVLSISFYDFFKKILLKPESSTSCILALSIGVTLAANIIVYPIDTIRHRMIMTSGEPNKYNGSFDCCKKILKTEGFSEFMNGIDFFIIKDAFMGFVKFSLKSLIKHTFNVNLNSNGFYSS